MLSQIPERLGKHRIALPRMRPVNQMVTPTKPGNVSYGTVTSRAIGPSPEAPDKLNWIAGGPFLLFNKGNSATS